ncbi:MAG: hypothetical protein JW729_05450, partial [Bacteroidales bacterium]|nr:hypothetical protein [Bacteroidales bacterium]
VFSVDADTTQPIKPIVGPMKEPYTLMEILPWIIFGAAVLVLIFTMFYFYRKRKKKPIFKSKEEPKIAPNVKALDALAVLRLKKLWQAGKVKAYHTELTEIVRTYIEDRFGIMAVEMTTDEILVEIKPIIANAVAINKLKSSLELADLVKFAKANPTALENDTSLNFAVDFVNESNAQNSVLQEEEVENVE